ncbi:hypothetical protein BJF81_00190 [Ornithinimicrobium sp. CNJ-824]|uniref:hypothetical protein n=1 Tax=Ornithinimicrobium sp. CNJ-824 TaxID=1904966 RepID=UPI00095F354E|nr:hypothetical protein [Ornithinimicrobium sp. CNJ-824]OLT22326.1 hypothetical protein BJF81_00190 [Ornithinimicrobium sp. CNJ-824]
MKTIVCVATTKTQLATAEEVASAGLKAGDIITLVIGLLAFVAAVATIVATIHVASRNIIAQQKENRRQERANAYAEAIRAVEDYLETPYRIRRRDGSVGVRWELTESISAIQSRISFHKDWLRINAPYEVYEAYLEFDQAARVEAGRQMTAAWNGPVTKKDRQVPLRTALQQPQSAAAKDAVLDAMKNCLKT